MADTIKVQILDDGTIKMETDKVSQANHGGAEMFIRELVKAAGGGQKRKLKAHAHVHEHDGHHHSH